MTDWLDHFQGVSNAANALREKWEIDTALEVCRACEHFNERDPARDGMPTCAKCTSCSTKIVRFLTRRWDCPEGKWLGWTKPSIGLMPWEAVWNLHAGKTFLVIGRGPSRDEIDLSAIERDVTIAANLSLWEPEKQLAPLRREARGVRREGNTQASSLTPQASSLIYDVSTDEGPCRLGRPAGAKLCTNANTDAGRKARANCDIWVCFPHHVYAWGPIERGKKLPTAFNSGIAGITLALYMGAKQVKFVGIDYRQAPAGGMHANDATESNKARSVKQFDATFARVQRAAHEVARWSRSRGIALENLARDSRLDWSVPPAERELEKQAELLKIATKPGLGEALAPLGLSGKSFPAATGFTLKAPPEGIKLYPGAGLHRRQGFLHTDLRPGVAQSVQDIREIPWRFTHQSVSGGGFTRPSDGGLDDIRIGDAAVSDLYLSHVLEHVPFREVEAVLDECARVVRPGGRIEVRVPDLRSIMEWVLGAQVIEHGHIARIFGGQDYPENTHTGGFDALSLERSLWQAGFEEVKVERIGREPRDKGMELRATARRRTTGEGSSHRRPMSDPQADG